MKCDEKKCIYREPRLCVFEFWAFGVICFAIGATLAGTIAAALLFDRSADQWALELEKRSAGTCSQGG